MDRGYVRLWRKSMDSEAFMDDGMWRLWSMILMEASWKSRKVRTPAGRGFDVVSLEAGQLVFGSSRWADLLRTPKSTVHRRLKRLEKAGNITIKPGRHYSVVTVCNWDIYQPAEGGRGTQSGTESGRNRDNAKKGKKDNNSGRQEAGREKDAPPAPSPRPDSKNMGWMRLHCYIPPEEADAFGLILTSQPWDLIRDSVLICRAQRREKGLNLRVCMSDLVEQIDYLVRKRRKKKEEPNDDT